MALSDLEKQNIQQQINSLEDKIAAEKVASEGLKGKEKEAAENESVIRKQWLRSHFIIHSYEKEIEKINGEYILAPFTEDDIYNQANETGRLYQAPANQDPKTIPEMIGLGLAPTPKTPHEGTYITMLNRLMTTLVSGDNGGASGVSSTLSSGYVAGSNTIATSSQLTANKWYLIGGVTYVKVGSISNSGGPTPTYGASIVERYPVVGLDVSVSSGSAIVGFSGYNNTERTNKVATTTPQATFNILYNAFKSYVALWKGIIQEQLDIQTKNTDPDMDTVAKANNGLFISDITAYETAGWKINNGTPGIGTIQAIITNRNSYRVTRPTAIKTAKEKYYAERVNFTRMRCNIQSGTLTRVKFLDTLRGLTPAAGNPDYAKTLKSLKALLEQG